MPTPEINQPVMLQGTEGQFASRVEGLEDDGVLILARPFGLPLDTDLDAGEPFDVLWTTDAGVYELAASVTERYVDGKVRIWHAQPLGPVRRTNRRAHIRVPVTAPVTLETAGNKLTATMLDISEAALRCQINGPLAEVDEDGVHLQFALGETQFRLDGAIFRATPMGKHTELVITLTLHEQDQTAAELRRAVFAEQIRTRQLER
jgi:c-di-GMP-binding flagellar brake protein YcgR